MSFRAERSDRGIHSVRSLGGDNFNMVKNFFKLFILLVVGIFLIFVILIWNSITYPEILLERDYGPYRELQNAIKQEDQEIRNIFTKLIMELENGNLEKASEYFVEERRSKQLELFKKDRKENKLVEKVEFLKENKLLIIEISNTSTTRRYRYAVDIDGRVWTEYYVDFVKDQQGWWKILSW